MKTINSYETDFTKVGDREKIDKMAIDFFQQEYKLELEKFPEDEREAMVFAICDDVYDACMQSTESVSFVARNTENQDILGFMSAETYRRDGILIKFIITNKEYKVSTIYKDFMIEGIRKLIRYFGDKKIYIKLADKNQRGVAFLKRTFETKIFDSNDYSVLEIVWTKYFFENNIRI